jgi:dTDP-4-amino-4,6-dideoxygalactose transaminase
MADTVPPTAGLPLRLADLRPWGSADLAGALARWLGVAQVRLECSGTSALVTALRALQTRAPGRDEIIAPAYTCPLVALAVAQCGLRRRLCDLRADALDMAPDALRALCGARTLAVLPTHLCGRVADVPTALECARAVGAYVIEDAAQALGARLNGQSVGTLGDMGFFSLAVGKGLTTFEGGALLARDAALLAAQPQAAFSGWWELRRSVELLGYAALYRPRGLRRAYGAPLQKALARGDWVEAAGDAFSERIPRHRLGRWRQRVARRALERLTAFQRQTARQAERRCALLRAIPGIDVVGDAAPGAQGVWPVLALRLPSQRARDALLRAHWGAGWGLSLPFAHALPDYGRYDHALAWARGDRVEQARDWAARLVSVSNSPWLGDDRFAALLEILKRVALYI